MTLPPLPLVQLSVTDVPPLFVPQVAADDAVLFNVTVDSAVSDPALVLGLVMV